MVLRELITRFGFELDKKGERDYNKKIAGMKRSALKFAAIFGVGFGAKELFQVGTAAERAKFNLRRLAGTDTDFINLRKQFKQTNKELNRLKEGIGDRITTREFDIAASQFVKVFGRGQEQIKTFGELWKFSAKQSALTGKNVGEIMSQLQSGVTSGNFDFLIDLPGFTQVEKQLAEFRDQALNPNEPGGRIAIQRRFRDILNIINQAAREQDAAISLIPKEVIESDKAAKSLKETFDNLGKTLNTLLVPVLEQLNKLLGFINEKTGLLSSKRKSPGIDLFKDVMKVSPDSQLGKASDISELFLGKTGVRGRSEAAESWNSIWGDILRITKQAEEKLRSRIVPRPSEPRREQNIVINNDVKIDVKSTDPRAVGIEVRKQLENVASEGRKRVIKTEDTE